MTDRNKKEFSPEEQAIVQTAIDKSYQRDIQRDKINQTIHEARGLCWHEGEIHYARMLCKKCGVLYSCYDHNPNYTSDWSAWGAALEWAQGEEWWERFIKEVSFNAITFLQHHFDLGVFTTILLTPKKGATALAEFIDKHFKKKGEGK